MDPYGLVAKAGTWYLVADRRGAPRLFRADRVASATLTDAPVRRRAGVELAEVWRELRRGVEERPAGVRVTARIRPERLDLAVRILGPALTGPPRTGDPEDDWAVIELAYPVVEAVRQLLQFGDTLEVLHPPQARRVMARAAAALGEMYDGEDAGPRDDRPSRRA
ncbi:helix-turn-helix transcriptional regulator [Streptomyces sp. NPDC101227]|uniref:helix-turn-helix transcriptional regulator n=1 Tax=Streptomyces sp. NPDC101227 TaxID=3366136 RepID=UPI00381D2071